MIKHDYGDDDDDDNNHKIYLIKNFCNTLPSPKRSNSFYCVVEFSYNLKYCSINKIIKIKISLTF